MKNNFLYPVSVSGTTLLCDKDLIELVRQKSGDQLADFLANRLSSEKIKDHLSDARARLAAMVEPMSNCLNSLDIALDLIGDEE